MSLKPQRTPPNYRQSYETVIFDDEGALGAHVLVIPRRSIEDYTDDAFVPFLLKHIGLSQVDYDPVKPMGVSLVFADILSTDYKQVPQENRMAFAQHVCSVPFIPFESSPLQNKSLGEILSGGSYITGGTTIGTVIAGQTPFLLITVPLGIVIMGGAVSLSKWLVENRNKIWDHVFGFEKPKAARGKKSKEETSNQAPPTRLRQ